MLFLLAAAGIAAFAATHRVYALFRTIPTNVMGMNANVIVRIDLGQFQSGSKNYTLLDENGKELKFNSPMAALNYMSERGWVYLNNFERKPDNIPTEYWLMYKEVENDSQITEGWKISNYK